VFDVLAVRGLFVAVHELKVSPRALSLSRARFISLNASSAAFQRALPIKSSSSLADQAAATTVSAFARAAPARTNNQKNNNKKK